MRLVHLSDLHFGREREDVLEALRETLAEIQPELVVVSGDFTQRARRRQFEAARRFLRPLPCPWLAVPGNHDIPLYNLPARLLSPLRGYRRMIHHNTEVSLADSGVAILGLDTNRRFTWNTGRLSAQQIQRACAFFKQVPRDWARLLVTHHPLVADPGYGIRNSEIVLRGLREAGVDAILSGHLHISSMRLLPLGQGEGTPYQIQAGTAISARERGETNAFNELDIVRDRIQLRLHTWAEGRFKCGAWNEYPLRPHVRPEVSTDTLRALSREERLIPL